MPVKIDDATVFQMVSMTLATIPDVPVAHFGEPDPAGADENTPPPIFARALGISVVRRPRKTNEDSADADVSLRLLVYASEVSTRDSVAAVATAIAKVVHPFDQETLVLPASGIPEHILNWRTVQYEYLDEPIDDHGVRLAAITCTGNVSRSSGNTIVNFPAPV